MQLTVYARLVVSEWGFETEVVLNLMWNHTHTTRPNPGRLKLQRLTIPSVGEDAA